MRDLKLFVPITKVDEQKRLVYGIATAEHPDKSGEICDYESTVPHYKEWSSNFSKVTDGKSMGNLRSMHGKVAVGKLTDIVFNDSQKQIEICAKVVDDNEWKKVVEGVYTGFSQGGSYIKRWDDPKDPALKRYTAKPSEVSLVDEPCLDVARFEYVKSDGTSELRKFVKEAWNPDDHPRDAKGMFTVVGEAVGAIAGGLIGTKVGAAVGTSVGELVGSATGSTGGPVGIISGGVAGAAIGNKIGAIGGGIAGAYVGEKVGDLVTGRAAANPASGPKGKSKMATKKIATAEEISALAKSLAEAKGADAKPDDHVAEATAQLEKLHEDEFQKAVAEEAAAEALAKKAEEDALAKKAEADLKKAESELPEVTQGWRVPTDGMFFAKKADAIAHAQSLLRKSEPDPVADAMSALIKTAKGEDEAPKLGKLAPLAKYAGEEVWDSARAIDCLSTIVGILWNETNDPTQDPAQIQSLKDAISAMKDFIASEIQEDNSGSSPDDGAEGTDDSDQMAMSARIGELSKWFDESAAKLAKVGARHNAADLSSIQHIHDTCVKLGCTCPTGDEQTRGQSGSEADVDPEKSAKTGELAKLAEDNASLRKRYDDLLPQIESIATIVKEQREELAKLRKMASPPPQLRVVAKGSDIIAQAGSVVNDDITAALAKMTPEQKAELMVKVAQQTPLHITSRGVA